MLLECFSVNGDPPLSRQTTKTRLQAKTASTMFPACVWLGATGLGLFCLAQLDNKMAGVAQLVRAPVCGTGGRRFKTGHSPHLPPPNKGDLLALDAGRPAARWAARSNEVN